MPDQKPAIDRPLAGMRIAFIYSPGHVGVDCAASLLRGLERGLLELGAEVRTLNLALYKRSIVQGRGAWSADNPFIQGMIQFLREEWPGQKIDLCFALLHDVYLTEELQETLRARCNRVVNYPLNLLDQPQQFERALQFCDLTLCAEEGALADLEKRAPGRIRYMPMASDPWIFRRLKDASSPRLLFVGSLYANRQWLLDRCARSLPVSIYSVNQNLRDAARGIARELVRHGKITTPLQAMRILKRATFDEQRHVSDEEFVRLASEHGVSIGLSDVTQEGTLAKLHKVRLREYEAAMCGLCHLARRLPELERGFEDGREMIFYDDEAEIPDRLSAIARGAIDFRAVGRAARARAARDHNWTVRLRQALPLF